MKMQITQKYFTIIIAVISLTCLLSCQKEASRFTSTKIVYTDIIPDTIVSNPDPTYTNWGIYNLDLNKDGINDFTFECEFGKSRCMGSNYATYSFWATVKVRPVENSLNEILNSVDLYLDTIPVALDSLATISSTSVYWRYYSYGPLIYSSHCMFWATTDEKFGNWHNGVDKYLGLKLVKGTHVFYGWVRLNVLAEPVVENDPGILEVKEYAYNSNPNEPILAGQKE